ncbi:small integral membrane protein 24 [Cheilinus undulatus]|uniref:small integral membrane protein 24 n=1 Tax=Cheilinus undulatus TaxID=241271 RepID=UPI001BD299FF|nr:small integral membrane protein 24 [Cheilinus undulatus]
MNLLFLLACVLLSATCSANKGVRTGIRVSAGSESVTLQPWLVGLSAVVGFLFIVFAVLIIHRLLRKDRKHEEEWGYDNKVIEIEHAETKQTSL